jgi:hypothetical protein
MNIPYDVINEALAKELPDVDLRPDPLGLHTYVLHFEEDEPTEGKINRAMEIVDKMLPSEWYPDEVRRL